MKIIKYFFEFIIIIFLFIIFKLLGRKLSSDLGCLISNYVGFSFRSKKRISTNFKKAFPGLGSEEENKHTREMWCNFGRTFSGGLSATGMFSVGGGGMFDELLDIELVVDVSFAVLNF